LLGMISTHFREPHRPSDRDLCLLDLYAIQAAAMIERRQAEAALRASEGRFRSLVQSLPAAVYTCDIDGRITLFNDSAIVLWGRTPALNVDQWCGSFRLYRLDGAPVLLDEHPMAVALKTGRGVAGEEVVVERPDGTRRNVIPYPEPLRDASGAVVGAVNMMVDITWRKRAETEAIALKNALAVELAGMTRLHEFSTRLLAETDFQRLLEDVLDAIVVLQSADLGTLHLYDPDTQRLEIAAHRGFETAFLQSVRDVGAESRTACGRALRDQKRVIVEDVEADPAYGPYREAAIAAGFRAVQSAPMFSRTSQPLGVISTYFRSPHRPSGDVLRMTDLYARQAAEMIESKQSEAALRKYQHELRELTTRLIEAQESQSKHLARELHDVFSQRLAAIGMDLGRLAEIAVQSTAPLVDPLLKLTEQIGTLAKEIHLISRQIHPAILDDLGLSAAIRSECLAFSKQYGMATEFTSDRVPRQIPEDVALCLYRVAQESLRNIGRHAGVSEVSVRLNVLPGELALAIDDAGQGFDAEGIKGKRGLGLVSMEERLRIVGGALSIRSQQGRGTHIEARVPIAP
jgi:signal transduction histidine kinase